jgi:uncharacterized membrane protein
LTDRAARRAFVVFTEETINAFQARSSILGTSLAVFYLLAAGNTFIIFKEEVFDTGFAFLGT